MGYFREIGSAAANIAKGLWVTLRYLFKPSITVQYPTEKLVPFERFRGALLFDADVCISCNLCVKACPSNCIALENDTNEAGKKVARVNWYTIDFGKCNFCRLCEEACPTKPKSVWHSLDYELTFSNRPEMVRTWFVAGPGMPHQSETAKKAREFKAGEGVVTDDFVGVWFDPKSGHWAKPPSQVQIQEVQARR